MVYKSPGASAHDACEAVKALKKTKSIIYYYGNSFYNHDSIRGLCQ
uniref:Uncharacterized protein n=1 Tax=Anguilla anguilla TaxID=7936 RepID=A0A0E9WSY3_ANGAN